MSKQKLLRRSGRPSISSLGTGQAQLVKVRLGKLRKIIAAVAELSLQQKNLPNFSSPVLESKVGPQPKPEAELPRTTPSGEGQYWLEPFCPDWLASEKDEAEHGESPGHKQAEEVSEPCESKQPQEGEQPGR